MNKNIEEKNMKNKNPFRILITGLFASGRSTLINALLRDNVLKSFADPLSMQIKTIRYDKDRKNFLYFKQSFGSYSLEETPERINNHILQYGSKNTPPIEISEIELDSIRNSYTDKLLPYRQLEITLPNNYLKHGLEIITIPMPCLFEDNDKLLFDLTYIDCIIHISNACSPCSQNEMGFLEELVKRHNRQSSTIIVVNRIDIIPPDDLPLIKNFCCSKIAQFSDYNVVYASALKAIEGIEQNDEFLYEQSGIPILKQLLLELYNINTNKIYL